MSGSYFDPLTEAGILSKKSTLPCLIVGGGGGGSNKFKWVAFSEINRPYQREYIIVYQGLKKTILLQEDTFLYKTHPFSRPTTNIDCLNKQEGTYKTE